MPDLGTKTIKTGDSFELEFRHDTGVKEIVPDAELVGLCMDLTGGGGVLLLFEEHGADGIQSVDVANVVSVGAADA